MEIIKISDSIFKIKGKNGFAETDPKGIKLESLDGASSKIFTTPGEYEVAGISVIGIKTEEGIVFVYEVDGLRVCHLGGITKKLSDTKVSQIGDIDVLLVPVTNDSVQMMQQIESYYVIPFGYKTEEELDKFLKDSGLTVEKMNKFSLKKDDLIEDSAAQIVVLSQH